MTLSYEPYTHKITAPKTRQRLFLEVPAQADQAGPLRHAVRDLLQRAGWSAADVGDVTLAVGEAAANAISYSNASQRDLCVSLCCGFIDDGRIQIEIRNSGGDFMPDLQQVTQLPEDDAVHGRGFALMSMLMDHVTVRSEGDDTVVRMSKRRTD